jgi:hypothetical protein
MKESVDSLVEIKTIKGKNGVENFSDKLSEPRNKKKLILAIGKNIMNLEVDTVSF